MAFNLMVSLIFGLSAVGAYGILYNLLAMHQRRRPEPVEWSTVEGQPSGQPSLSSFLFPLLGPLFLLIVSNVEGFLEVLHRKGFFWNFGAQRSPTSSFWTWLDLKDLSAPPLQPLGWIPERFWWWYRLRA
jgi:hypothetical protein